MPAQIPSEFRDLLRGRTRLYYAATLLGAFGTGLVLSYEVVYVTDVRHLSLWFADALLAASALASFALAPISGYLTDRFGPVRQMLACIAIFVCGEVLYAFATTELQFGIACAVLVIGGSGTWGPGSTLLTRLVGHEHRTNAYALNFLMLNLGIGLGTLISSFCVNLKDAHTFTALYLANAAMSLCGIFFIARLWKFGQAVPSEDIHESVAGEGWREVLHDALLVRYIGVSLLLMICGYGSIQAAFSYYVVNIANLSVHYIGVTFCFNTITIVIGQLYALRFINGRRRSQVMGMAGALWGVSWLFVATCVVLPKYAALVMLCLSTIVFALGETFWQPVSAALVNELAPEHLRGRYNSAAGFVWSVSGVLAPFLLPVFVFLKIGAYWPLFVAVGCLAGAYLATTMRRHLTDRHEGIDEIQSTSADTVPSPSTPAET